MGNQLLLSELSLGELDRLTLRSLNVLLLLLGEDLNVAWCVHVGVDSTVGSVGSSSTVLGFVALNMSQDKLLDVEGLSFSVGNQVLQESDDNLGRLNWPATLGVLELLSLSSSGNK